MVVYTTSHDSQCLGSSCVSSNSPAWDTTGLTNEYDVKFKHVPTSFPGKKSVSFSLIGYFSSLHMNDSEKIYSC